MIVALDEHMHIEITPPGGPQWQARVRFLMGKRGQLVTHGNLFCSRELAELLASVLPGRCGRAVTVSNRMGPEPVTTRSEDERR